MAIIKTHIKPDSDKYKSNHIFHSELSIKLQADLKEIAKGQLKSNQENQICDTDLITIKIWSEYKYGNCNNWILEQIEKQKTENRFYLLCKPDTPWEADPLRENPTNREELFEIYKEELEKLKHNYSIIEGEERIKNSISKISSLISNN